ncbi:MAG: F0F1 ATP synthase subunit epsilon [Candidatus Riflebacteria bacterium]|nr:F0F1 ATP synthase subunit epsilon [Candidatus Riflebacteria bacterium]
MSETPHAHEHPKQGGLSSKAVSEKKTFDLCVIAVGHTLYTCRARMLSVPGETGSLGVMAGHVPLLTTLTVGLLHIIDEFDEHRWFAVTGGFFEMMGDHATILADHLVGPADIAEDVAAFERAKKVLVRPPEFPSDVARVEMARALMARKLVQLRSH